jgi:Tfp pilus assembly protein PilO
VAFDWRTEYHRYHRYYLSTQALYRKREIVVYTGIILTLLAIAFFALFAIKPTVTTVAGLFKDISNQKEVDQKMQAKINSIRQAQTNYSLISDKLVLVDQVLPQEPGLIDLIYQVEILTQKNNIDLKSVGFESSYILGEKTGQKKIVQTPAINFSLAVSGDYESVNNFLTSLENLRRALGISDFSVRSFSEEETGKFGLNLNLQLEALYLTKGSQP